jgi:hypothetical protein
LQNGSGALHNGSGALHNGQGALQDHPGAPRNLSGARIFDFPCEPYGQAHHSLHGLVVIVNRLIEVAQARPCAARRRGSRSSRTFMRCETHLRYLLGVLWKLSGARIFDFPCEPYGQAHHLLHGLVVIVNRLIEVAQARPYAARRCGSRSSRTFMRCETHLRYLLGVLWNLLGALDF